MRPGRRPGSLERDPPRTRRVDYSPSNPNLKRVRPILRARSSLAGGRPSGPATQIGGKFGDGEVLRRCATIRLAAPGSPGRHQCKLRPPFCSGHRRPSALDTVLLSPWTLAVVLQAAPPVHDPSSQTNESPSAQQKQMPSMSEGPLGNPQVRNASGTAWQPDSTPMRAVHFMADDWTLMGPRSALRRVRLPEHPPGRRRVDLDQLGHADGQPSAWRRGTGTANHALLEPRDRGTGRLSSPPPDRLIRRRAASSRRAASP